MCLGERAPELAKHLATKRHATLIPYALMITAAFRLA
jgi:hypothetical protein